MFRHGPWPKGVRKGSQKGVKRVQKRSKRAISGQKGARPPGNQRGFLLIWQFAEQIFPGLNAAFTRFLHTQCTLRSKVVAWREQSSTFSELMCSKKGLLEAVKAAVFLPKWPKRA